MFVPMDSVNLSVVIPCYNEANTIERVISAVLKSPVGVCEVIVVNDCSTDGTAEVLNRITDPRVKVLHHPVNQGKGGALITGFQSVTGNIVIIQDADLEYDPTEYGKMIGPITSGKADVVFGSRFMGSGPHRVVYYWHRVGNQVLTLLSNMFTNINLTDMETGFKAFRVEVLRKLSLKERRFGIEPEITAKICKLKCRIFEVGISYNGRTYEEGKKIGWRDGVAAIFCIIRYNLFR